MKTNLVKAAIALILMVATISVNAQNTKSFKENSVAHKISTAVKSTFSNGSQELTEQLNNLKKLVQYTPEESVEYNTEAIAIYDINLSELESVIKYKPGCFDETVTYSNDTFTETLKELEHFSKFRPNESDLDNLAFENIQNELAATVKYTPAS